MPRRPSRDCSVSQVHPIFFSPFARCLTRVLSATSTCHSSSKSRNRRKISSHYRGEKIDDNSVDKGTENSESSEEEESELIVQADFAFFDPKPEDFHGVKVLLQTYLDNKEWDLSGFVDLILAQTTVGSVVKIEDEEENSLFSVITVINLGRYNGHQCISDIKEFLAKVCQDKGLKDELRLLLKEQAHTIGLLVSQRVVNLPPQLLPPLYDGLFDEVSWAIEDEPTEELRDSFRFKYYLLVTKIYKQKSAGQRKSKSKGGYYDEPVIYSKVEDEIFAKLCLWSFTYTLQSQLMVPLELKNYDQVGLVMVIPADKIPTFRVELKSLICEI